MKVIKRIMETE